MYSKSKTVPLLSSTVVGVDYISAPIQSAQGTFPLCHVMHCLGQPLVSYTLVPTAPVY